MPAWRSATPTCYIVFFFNDTATTEIYPLPLPDALPIPRVVVEADPGLAPVPARGEHLAQARWPGEAAFAELVEHHVADRAQRVQADEVGERERAHRSEEHTSELQSRLQLVCRLLLENKNDERTVRPAYRSPESRPLTRSRYIAGSLLRFPSVCQCSL